MPNPPPRHPTQTGHLNKYTITLTEILIMFTQYYFYLIFALNDCLDVVHQILQTLTNLFLHVTLYQYVYFSLFILILGRIFLHLSKKNFFNLFFSYLFNAFFSQISVKRHNQHGT